jgi:hypothetical protein
VEDKKVKSGDTSNSKLIGKERLANLWIGIVVAAIIAIIIAYFLKEQKEFKRLEASRKASLTRERNPNPSTLDEFCEGAEPSITPAALFEKPLKYLKQRVCLLGGVQWGFPYRLPNGSYYHVLSNTKRMVITVSWPPESNQEKYLGEVVNCGGYVEPPLQEDQFDYLAHIHCQFLELKDINKEMIFPALTDSFKENGWRRAIVDKVGSDQREIWMDQKNEWGLEVIGTPQQFKKVTLTFIHPREPEKDETTPPSPYENCRLLWLGVTTPSQLADVESWFTNIMRVLEASRRLSICRIKK